MANQPISDVCCRCQQVSNVLVQAWNEIKTPLLGGFLKLNIDPTLLALSAISYTACQAHERVSKSTALQRLSATEFHPNTYGNSQGNERSNPPLIVAPFSQPFTPYVLSHKNLVPFSYWLFVLLPPITSITILYNKCNRVVIFNPEMTRQIFGLFPVNNSFEWMHIKIDKCEELIVHNHAHCCRF